MIIHGHGNKFDKQIDIKQNSRFTGIEVKSGENQYSCHSHIHQVFNRIIYYVDKVSGSIIGFLGLKLVVLACKESSVG